MSKKRDKQGGQHQSTDLIRDALKRVFRDCYDDAASPQSDARTSDFVFHMLDWQDDLQALAGLYKNPPEPSSPKWDRAVNGFLLHAVGHLIAAARLSGWVPDPFVPKLKGPTKANPRARVRQRAKR